MCFKENSGKGRKTSSSEQEQQHVMLSYKWESQPVVLKVTF